MGDFSEEKESGAYCYEDGKHRQGLEPFRQIRSEIESTNRKEDASEKGNAKDLPVKMAVIEPESGPVLKTGRNPLHLRLELLAAARALPRKARPTLRPCLLPELPVSVIGILIPAFGTMGVEKLRFHFISFGDVYPVLHHRICVAEGVLHGPASNPDDVLCSHKHVVRILGIERKV